MRPLTRRVAATAALAASLGLVSCGTASAPAPSEGGVGGTLSVYAAASLAGAFDEMAAAFERQHPGVDVAPVYDGSSTLATQIREGAPADVFASADEATMAGLADAAPSPRLFATNTLVIVVPQDNPAGIETLGDLPAATVVLCAPEVPCGAASAALLSAAGVTVTPASVEQNVTAVLTKVAAGEADAGLVYATDARASDAVSAIVPAGAAEVVNRYPIAALAEARNPVAAAAFVDFVVSAAGREVLADFGFGTP